MGCTQIGVPPDAGTLAVCPTAAPGCFDAERPRGAGGRGCRRGHTRYWPGDGGGRVSARDEARGQVVREAFLGRRRGRTRTLLLHIPPDASRLTLAVFADGQTDATVPAVRLRVLHRAVAAVRLMAFGWRRLPACLRGDRSGMAGRVRSEVGQAPARAGEAPPYDVWCRLYQSWDDAVRAPLMLAIAGCARLEVVIAPPQDRLAAAEALVAASLACVAAQWSQPARVVVCGQDGAWQRMPGTWLLILHAGELLVPSATACFALAIGRCPAEARLVYADLDETQDAVRANPLFKPPADPWLRESGLLTRGCCAVHPDIETSASLLAGGAPRAVRAGRMSAEAMQRIPLILTHVPAGLPAARLQPPRGQPDDTPKVSIIVPTACRSHHVLRCLRGLLAATDYADFEILLVVSGIDPADRLQRALLAEAAGLPALRVVDAGDAVFNYAAANNVATQQAAGELLLLLNDDVLPIRADWLRRLVAFTTGAAQADIVGARLLYGNDRVQHGGVIVGLANLCENAFRLSDRSDAGPHGIALLDRQVSAVTAACMLVRRSVWQDERGFDESFCIALNDVDFCLRAGQAGARIVFAAGVELYHFESLSLGRHYRGERAALEVREVRRLRDRWQSLIADDPFYNPQASLEPGREFQPAFPPRLTPLRWVAGEDVEQR